MTSIDAPLLLRAITALAIVLLGVVAIAWLLRRWSPMGISRRDGGRLAVVAAQPLDTRTRLVLVRRDEAEHLLAVGPNGVTVVETVSTAADRSLAGSGP